MCLSCGCGVPNATHGDKRNITKDKLQAAANASDISMLKAVENMRNALLNKVKPNDDKD